MKTLIFDFWGTLVENGVRSPIKQVRNQLRIKENFSEYVVRMEKIMMTRKFASLRNAFLAIAKEFGKNPPDYVIENLIGMWNKSWMLAKPYEEVAEVLSHLKQGNKLILVSNTDQFSVTKVMEKFDLAKYFDKLYFSFETGKLKTDEGFLLSIIDNPENFRLVGDSIQSDMKAAHDAGIVGILVDRRNTRDFSPKIVNLRELK